jgi:acyl-CoA hydrolase
MERIRDKDLEGKIVDPMEAVNFIPKRGVLAFAGMAGTAYPKVIPRALAERVKNDKEFGYVILNGGSVGEDFDEAISKVNIMRRYPLGSSSERLRKEVNSRSFEVSDLWLFEFSRWIRFNVFKRRIGEIDVAVIEATAITEGGEVIPSLSLDSAPSFVESAKKVIIEVSLKKPELSGIHDVYPFKVGDLIPIRGVLDRIGEKGLKIPKGKIAAIVLSNYDDSEKIHYSKGEEIDLKVAENIISFLSGEIKEDENLRGGRFTLQPGAGPIASLMSRRISELEVELGIWGEVASTSWLPTLSENVRGISSAVLYTLPGERKYREVLYNEFEEFKKKVVIRPYEIANNPQVILRFNHVVIQQAIEVDLFGNANITHIGDNLYGGVGGSGDHTRPSYLTIIALPSITSSGISRIVPITTHVSLPGHDVDIVITEQGWADLRLLSPTERAKEIIDKCSHPKHKDWLWDYYSSIIKQRGHSPINIEKAFKRN